MTSPRGYSLRRSFLLEQFFVEAASGTTMTRAARRLQNWSATNQPTDSLTTKTTVPYSGLRAPTFLWFVLFLLCFVSSYHCNVEQYVRSHFTTSVATFRSIIAKKRNLDAEVTKTLSNASSKIPVFVEAISPSPSRNPFPWIRVGIVPTLYTLLTPCVADVMASVARENVDGMTTNVQRSVRIPLRVWWSSCHSINCRLRRRYLSFLHLWKL